MNGIMVKKFTLSKITKHAKYGNLYYKNRNFKLKFFKISLLIIYYIFINKLIYKLVLSNIIYFQLNFIFIKNYSLLELFNVSSINFPFNYLKIIIILVFKIKKKITKLVKMQTSK